jgi:hypothetical protein
MELEASGNRVVIDPLKSVSWALVREGVSDDINPLREIPLPDYDQDVDPALFTDSGSYPVTRLTLYVASFSSPRPLHKSKIACPLGHATH